MRLRDKKSALLREIIQESAIKIVEEEGVEQITVRRIAQDLGCSVGVIYNYFQNKDEILKEIYIHTCRTFLKELKSLAATSQNQREEFVALALFICEFRITHSRRYREIFLHQVFTTPPAELQQVRIFVQDRLEALALAGLPTRERVQMACSAILALAEGIASHSREKFTPEDRQIMEQAMRALLKGWS